MEVVHEMEEDAIKVENEQLRHCCWHGTMAERQGEWAPEDSTQTQE